MRLGLSEEGWLRDAEWLYDHFVDHLVYATLDAEWRAESSPHDIELEEKN